jgi:hypothetical protein
MKTRFGHLVVNFLICTTFVTGCASVTAVNLNDPKAPDGIPYYLPKPYLFVSKNVRYIPTPTVGLTEVVVAPPGASDKADTSANKDKSQTNNDSGNSDDNEDKTTKTKQKQPKDSQDDASATILQEDPLSDPGVRHYAGKVASVILASDTETPAAHPTDPNEPSADKQKPQGGNGGNAGDSKDQPATQPSTSQVFGPPNITVVPAASIPDEMHPETFFTYQIVYLPDLTQKYGLRVKGGAGEMRQTMNLVNGWMYTGGGPMYFNDSTVSQDITSVGSAVGSVAGAVAKAFSPISAISGGKNTGTAGGQDLALTAATQPQSGSRPTSTFENYAVLYVYEPELKRGDEETTNSVTWKLVDGFPISFPREYTSVSVDSQLQQLQPATVNGDDSGHWTDPDYRELESDLKGKALKAGGTTYTISIATIDSKNGMSVTLAPTPPSAEASDLERAARALANNRGAKIHSADAVPTGMSVKVN